MDWLLSLPDPREEDATEGGVLRPLKASATQPRLPSRQPATSGTNMVAARRTAAGGNLAGGARARRPGSAQHPSKPARPPHGLGSGAANVAGMMSMSGGVYHPLGNSASKTMLQPLPQPGGMSGMSLPPSYGAAAPSATPAGRLSFGTSASDASLRNSKGSSGRLSRTHSGMLPPRKDLGGSENATPASSGGAATYSRGFGSSGLTRTSSVGVLTSGSLASGGRTAGAPEAASINSGGFRSEAIQLEVRFTEGLQALAESSDEGDGQIAARRLALCRSLFERIIERDSPFGRLLSRVKMEYESALKAAAQPLKPQLDVAQNELARVNRDMGAAKQAISTLQEENVLLRAELSNMVEREAQLRAEVRAYQEHAYELQQVAVQQAEADQAAVNAELERELPASARPGDVTHRLGGETLLVDEIAPPPPRPSNVPALNMGLVYAKKEADARAEAEDARAAPPEGGEADSEADGEADEADEEMEEEIARLRQLQDLMQAGELDDLLPRVLPPDEAAASISDSKPAPPAVPGLDLRAMTESSQPPESYHQEFMAAMEAARASGAVPPDGYDDRSAEVDRQLYADDPLYAKAAAPSEEVAAVSEATPAKDAKGATGA